MAGGYSIVVGGTAITASRENQYVSRQVVTRFAGDSARISAIGGDAEEGMLSYGEDTDLYKSYGSAGWRPLPGQMIARGNRASSSSTTTTTEIGVLRLDSVPVLAGMTYEIKTGPLYFLSSVDGDYAAANIRYAIGSTATVTSTMIGNGGQQRCGSIQPPSVPVVGHITAASTGNLSVLLTVVRTSGSGNVQLFNGCNLYVAAWGLADPGDTGIDI